MKPSNPNRDLIMWLTALAFGLALLATIAAQGAR